MTARLGAFSSQASRTFATTALPRFGANPTALLHRTQGVARNFCSHTPPFPPLALTNDVNPLEQNDPSFIFRAQKAAQVFRAASELPKNKHVETILEAAKLELDESMKPLHKEAETHFFTSSFPAAIRSYSLLQEFDPTDTSIARMLELSRKYKEQPFPTW
jgi:hypothetical protein